MSNSRYIPILEAERAEFANDLDVGCDRKKRIKDESSDFSGSYWKNEVAMC